MIIFAKEKHKKQIVSLWREAFGDEEIDILKYLEKILKYIVVFEEDDTVCGMLAMLPVTLGEEKGRYIYAVATRLDKRGNGISTELIEFAKNYIRENKETFLILVPQSESLFGFYEKKGFKAISCIENKVYKEDLNLCEVGEVRKITARDYQKSRESFFEDVGVVKWDCDMLKFAKGMYDGEFVSVNVEGIKIGTAFCIVMKESLCIKEMLSNKAEMMVKILKKEYGVSKVSYVVPSFLGEASAMMYPKTRDDVYFNIALD